MELIFVYNAHLGRINKLLDSAHKLISPKTYNCSLCMLTHGHFGAHDEWKSFLQDHGKEWKFYHIDDFESEYGAQGPYPATFQVTDQGLKRVMDSQTFNALGSLDELKTVIESKLALLK